MPTRSQPKVTTLTDNEPFDTQAGLDKINRNNEVIQAKFGALTSDDLTTTMTTFTALGSIDTFGNLVSNVKQCMNFINLREDGRGLEVIVANETSPIIFIEPNYTYQVTKKITLRSDVQIIGGGPSSVLQMISTSNRIAGGAFGLGFTMFEATAGAKNWSLKSFRMNGRRGKGLSSGLPLKITNCRSADAEIDSVWMGPLIDGATTFAFHDGPQIVGSSGIRMTNVQVRQASHCSLKMTHSNWNSLVQDIDIVESSFEQNSSTAIWMIGGNNIRIQDSWIGDNGATNVIIDKSSLVIFSGNDVYNASTASGGTDDGMFITGSANTKTTALNVMGNVFVDKQSPRTTKRHIRVNTNATYLTFMFNNFNSTTGDGGVLSYATARANMVVSQDKNTLHGGYKFLPNSNANKVTYQDWKNMDYSPPFGTTPAGMAVRGDPAAIRDFTRTYGNHMALPYDDYFSSLSRPWSSLYPDSVMEGLLDDTYFPAPSTSTYVNRHGNPGSLLTPERVEPNNGTTNLKIEVGAVIGTFNLGPELDDLGEVFASPRTPRDPNSTATQPEAYIWDSSGMGQSVLTAHLTLKTYLEILSHAYDVDSKLTTKVIIGRPTWVTVKI